jgi:predicted P-loop ATPase
MAGAIASNEVARTYADIHVSNVVDLTAQAWRRRLVVNDKGNPKSCVTNMLVLLEWHPDWRGLLEWDAFAERVCVTRPPPWSEEAARGASEQATCDEWTENDSVRLRDWTERTIHVSPKIQDADAAVLVSAEKRRVHPVERYLDGLHWDAKPRLAQWLTTYAGCEPSPYVDAVGMRWMISAVARIYRPGCQVDSMLILEGPQGARKSSLFRSLVPVANWCSETGITIGDKDSYQALHGIWIYLLDEIDSLKRGEATRIKNFISSPKDHYRPPYARRSRDFLRQNVFCGTTNEIQYLTDSSGNRRYWPVKVGEIDLAALVRDRDQLWAEAVAQYQSRTPWYLDAPELRALAEEETVSRRPPDPWGGAVAKWLVAQPICQTLGVTTEEVLTGAIGRNTEDKTRADEMRVAIILRELGYLPGMQVTENGRRVRRYTKQG